MSFEKNMELSQRTFNKFTKVWVTAERSTEFLEMFPTFYGLCRYRKAYQDYRQVLYLDRTLDVANFGLNR